MTLPGIRVIDLTQFIGGPLCTAQLGSLGAEVIKVERGDGDFTRGWGPKIKGESALFMQLNHDKKSVVIDYEWKEGLAVLRDLVKTADVFIEDFKPGEAERLGFGYDRLRRLKPDLIYCSICLFGDEGAYKGRDATELELQGMGGMMKWMGELDKEPIRIGADVYSVLTGMFTFSSIMAAIYNKKKRNRGERIVVPALAVAIAMAGSGILSLSGVDYWGGYWVTGPYDKPETGFKTKTKPIMFGMMTRDEAQARESFKEFCRAVGLDDLLKDTYYVEKGFRTLGMGTDAQEMKPLYEAAFEKWDAEELVHVIDKIGGLAAPLLSYKDLFDPLHEQVKANQMVVEQEHPRAGRIQLVNNPWRHTDGAAKIRLPSPALGEHTEEILKSLGYSSARVKRLRDLGIIK